MTDDDRTPTLHYEGGHPPPSELPSVGEPWGKYLIEDTLGTGRAVVFQAYDQTGLAGHVALKVPRHPVPPDRVERWLETEVKPLVRLQHLAIVRVVDAGRVDETPYIATEIVDGLPLNRRSETDPPTLREVCNWMVALADAVHYAHSQGIVHRDLKPQNIVITPAGKPVLLDFGVATLATAYGTLRDADVAGTIPYMAPEQARGDPAANHRMDVFGLGGVLKYLLEGRGPYGDEATSLRVVQEGKVEPATATHRPALRCALARIANRALSADPDARFASAADMATALRRARQRHLLTGLPAIAATLAVAVIALVAHLLSTGARQGHGPKAPQGDLQIHFQQAAQRGAFQILTPHALPLHAGDRVQIHARLAEPLYVYLVAVSSVGEATLLYPSQGDQERPATEVHLPTDRDEWFPLTPPPGTETILLLARRTPIADRAALTTRLRDLGPPPSIDGDGLLVVDHRGPRLLQARAERPIDARPVKAEKGFLDTLLERAPDGWVLVRAISFPLASRD